MLLALEFVHIALLNYIGNICFLVPLALIASLNSMFRWTISGKEDQIIGTQIDL